MSEKNYILKTLVINLSSTIISNFGYYEVKRHIYIYIYTGVGSGGRGEGGHVPPTFLWGGGGQWYVCAPPPTFNPTLLFST